MVGSVYPKNVNLAYCHGQPQSKFQLGLDGFNTSFSKQLTNAGKSILINVTKTIDNSGYSSKQKLFILTRVI